MPSAPKTTDGTFVLGNYLAWWTFQIFFLFFLLGEGEGGVRGAGGGGGRFFIENPRVLEEGEGPRGWEGVCSELGGGGLNIFWVAEMSIKLESGNAFVT